MPGAEPINPVEAVVARQLDAYHRHDVDDFVECFSLDVEIVSDGSDQKLVGRETMRTRYAAMFQKFPRNRCTLLSRVVVGHHAVDEELIEGRNEPPFRTVAIYTIKDGLIAHVRFLSRETMS
tara:strand:+ start:307 stop:672 length:366 start_codon:yes stop_codon:yes gene_type:complete